MRKRTVIITESREVWVIRQGSGETEGHGPDSQEVGPAAGGLQLPCADELEIDVTPEESTEV